MPYGDPLALPVYLTQVDGAGYSYANLAAAQTAGWSFLWYDTTGTILGSQPSATLTLVDAAIGKHRLVTTYPSQDGYLSIAGPTGSRAVPTDLLFNGSASGLDDIAALLTSVNGTPITASVTSAYNFTTVDGDSFSQSISVSASPLAPWGYTDLTDAAWILEGSIRETDDVATGTPLAYLVCAISNGATRTITFGWGVQPTALNLDTAAITNGSKDRRYDISARRTDSYTITAVTSGASGTFTIAGDKRARFSANAGATFTVTGGANAGTYTPTAINLVGGNTVITVATIPSAVVAGTIDAALRVTLVRGQLTFLRQEDRR
jgi:hypothetical protein